MFYHREEEVKLDGLLQKIIIDYAVVAVGFIVLVFVECLRPRHWAAFILMCYVLFGISLLYERNKIDVYHPTVKYDDFNGVLE